MHLEAQYVSLKSIVLELMATDFISRWDKSRMSFTFDDWLVRTSAAAMAKAHRRLGSHSSYWGVGVDNAA
jgi:hypothetical protein